jgi:hypothetical protein
MQGSELAVVAAVLLAIGCRLEIRCATATPLLALVHPHSRTAPRSCAPRQPPWPPANFIVAGQTTFSYEVRIERPASTDPEVPAAQDCAVQALPEHTLRNRASGCRDFAHLAITLCFCLNIPARFYTGYFGYTRSIWGRRKWISPPGLKCFWKATGLCSMPARTSCAASGPKSWWALP